MQVDDKLAKEKLARELDEMATAVTNVGKHKEHVFAYKVAADLIRNTDLTDCQPQGYFETNCAGDKCIANTTGCQRGHCQLKNFKNGQMTIAPAPDQGSVRNATDELVELRQTLKDECQLAADEEKRLKAQIKFLTDGESEVFAARAEVSRLRQDAQRYQMARTMQLHVYGDHDPHGAYIYHSGTSLDAVVDAAIRALPDQKD